MSIVLVTASIAATLPTDIKNEGSTWGTFRILGHYGVHGTIIEYNESGRYDVQPIHARSFKVGYRYRLIPNLKLGALVSKRYGVRHSEDWTWQLHNGSWSWQWKNKNSTSEDHIELEASPRFKIPFISDHTIFEFRTIYDHNLSLSDKDELVLRPGVTHHFLSGGLPLLSLFAKSDFWFSLNDSSEGPYQSWAYIGAIYHIDATLKLGFYTGQRKTTWKNTVAFRNKTNQTYSIEQTTWMTGLFLNIHSY